MHNDPEIVCEVVVWEGLVDDDAVAARLGPRAHLLRARRVAGHAGEDVVPSTTGAPRNIALQLNYNF